MELDKLFVVIQLLTIQTVSHAIKCFTCASADYKVLFERFSNIRHSLHIPRFGELCDNFERLHAFAPALNCESTCISILEPQYFGGVQSTNRPYSYIRGCAGKIFSSVQNRSPEVDFLHTEAICLELPLSLIWPSIETDEHMCSCKTDRCNTNTATMKNSNSVALFIKPAYPVFVTILILFLN